MGEGTNGISHAGHMILQQEAHPTLALTPSFCGWGLGVGAHFLLTTPVCVSLGHVKVNQTG